MQFRRKAIGLRLFSNYGVSRVGLNDTAPVQELSQPKLSTPAEVHVACQVGVVSGCR